MSKTICFKKYTDQEVLDHINDVVNRFAEALFSTGNFVTKEDAIKASEQKTQEFFPNNQPNERQSLYHIQDAANYQVVGFIWIANRDNGEARICDMAIKSEFQRQGYGKATMLLAEDFIKRDKFTFISLNVFENNIAARQLYEGLGYVVISEKSTGPGRLEMYKYLTF